MPSLRPFKPKNNPFFLLVLDAPNAEEARKNQTAAGSLGEVIEWLMKSSGLSGEYVAINALPTRTTDRPTAPQLIEDGRSHVARAVKKYKPSMVVAMGATAQVACGLSSSDNDRKGLLGKVHETEALGPVGACMSAWMIFREPRIKAKYEMMFAYFSAYAEHGGPPSIPPIEVRHLRTPKDVRRMVRSLERQAERKGRLPVLAYDHETASLVIEYAVLATMSFCSGLRNKKGEKVVWLWDHYQGDATRLGPVPPKWLKVWRNFFMRVDSLYLLVGHNAVAYDDQVVREQFRLPSDSEPGGFAGSSADTMLISWALDSTTPNGLKPQAGVMAGYFGYDDGLEPEIKKIVEQRNKYGRTLASDWRHVYTPEDQHLLDLLGIEPEPVEKKSGSKQPRLDAFMLAWPWPKGVDKKHGAYCLVPHDMLALYSAYDAAATYDLYRGQQQLVKAYGRQMAVELRLDAAKLLAEGERNGMFIDSELYEESARDLQEIAANAWASMVAELNRTGREWGSDAPFNPGSPPQVRHIIYGQAEHGWRIDVARTTEALQARRPGESRYGLYQIVETWATNLAFDPEYRALCVPGHLAKSMDAVGITKALSPQRKFLREKFRYDNGIYPALQQAPLYLAHLTDSTKAKPTLFTKTGLPSLKGAALLGLYEKTQDEFLKYLLVYQRAMKLDGTFVSGARKYIRPSTGLIHPHYNAIGTATGRISCCVRKGTLIETPTGPRPIETLKEGDLVLDQDGTPQPLLRDAFEKPDAVFYRVHLANGQQFECTGAHRLLCADQVWRHVSELSESSEIMSYSDTNVRYPDHPTVSRRFDCPRKPETLLWADAGRAGGGLLSAGLRRAADARADGRDFDAHLQDLHVLLPGTTPGVGVEATAALPLCSNQVRQYQRGTPPRNAAGSGRFGGVAGVLHRADCREVGDDRMVCAAFDASLRNCEHATSRTVSGHRFEGLALLGAIRSGVDRCGPRLLRGAWGVLRAPEHRLDGAAAPYVLFEGVQGVVSLSHGEGAHCTPPTGAVGGAGARVYGGASSQIGPHPSNSAVPRSAVQVRLPHRRHSDSRGMRWRVPYDLPKNESTGYSKDAGCHGGRVSDYPVSERGDSLRRGAGRGTNSTRIVRIEPLTLGTPWDITVANTHSYRACGAIHHNSAPNEQNRPEPLRGLVVPRHPDWTIVSADLSQAEIRVMAALSGDKVLMEALKGEDIHTSVASLMFNIPYAEVTKTQRKAAKTLNFGVLYGMSPHSLAAWLGITAEEAEALMDRYLGRFTRLAAYMEEQRVRALKPPYEVQTVWGTTISTLDALSYDRSSRGHALRVAVNAPVQGTAGELTLWFGIQIRKAVAERGWQDRVKFINTVHDSLTWEVHRSLAQGDPKDAAKWTGEFPELVQATFEAPVPVPPLDTVKFEGDIEVGDNWYGAPNAQKAAFSVVEDFDWESFKLEDMTDEERQDHQNLIEMYWETRAKKK